MRDLRASERMPGVDRIWMPGERSHEKRAAPRRSGIPMSAPLRASLDKLADELEDRRARITGRNRSMNGTPQSIRMRRRSLLAAAHPRAAQEYPNKPIHMVMPLPAGSAVDT